jgi:hypothetical protein
MDAPKGGPDCLYIEFGVRLQGRRFSRSRGREPEGGVLANLACKLRRLVMNAWPWLPSWSCAHVAAWCGVVLLYRPWWHCRHGISSPAVLCDVVFVVAFVIAWSPGGTV